MAYTLCMCEGEGVSIQSSVIINENLIMLFLSAKLWDLLKRLSLFIVQTQTKSERACNQWSVTASVHNRRLNTVLHVLMLLYLIMMLRRSLDLVGPTFLHFSEIEI